MGPKITRMKLAGVPVQANYIFNIRVCWIYSNNNLYEALTRVDHMLWHIFVYMTNALDSQRRNQLPFPFNPKCKWPGECCEDGNVPSHPLLHCGVRYCSQVQLAWTTEYGKVVLWGNHWREAAVQLNFVWGKRWDPYVQYIEGVQYCDIYTNACSSLEV